MTKEHLNEIMTSLCARLKIDKSDLVAVHEAGLVALGIDSNAIPYGLDFLLLNGTEGEPERGFAFEGFDIRLYTQEEFGLDQPISLVAPEGMDFPVLAPEGMDFPVLAPEVILETIHKSPDSRYLMEQRAALAELLHFDDMDDDELRQFAVHVRS